MDMDIDLDSLEAGDDMDDSLIDNDDNDNDNDTNDGGVETPSGGFKMYKGRLRRLAENALYRPNMAPWRCRWGLAGRTVAYPSNGHWSAAAPGHDVVCRTPDFCLECPHAAGGSRYCATVNRETVQQAWLASQGVQGIGCNQPLSIPSLLCQMWIRGPMVQGLPLGPRLAAIRTVWSKRCGVAGTLCGVGILRCGSNADGRSQRRKTKENQLFGASNFPNTHDCGGWWKNDFRQ
jgi:hypothetical protein